MKVKSQLIDAQLENRNSNPTKRGEIVFHTGDTEVKYHDGSTSQSVLKKDAPEITTGATLLNEAYLRFREATGNGSNYVGLKAPASLSGDTTYVLPASDGTNGQVLSTDGSGNMSWEDGGTGSGSKNYFDGDSSFIEGTVGAWLTDDGSAGAASYLTLTRTTTGGEVLAGTASLKMAKSANDASGEFIKLNTQTIDPIDRGKLLFGSFAVDATHTNFANSDLIVELYDVTNAAVLYSGSSSDLEILKVKGTFRYAVYTESTTAQIQLRIKINSTNASAYDVFFDEFKLGPAAQVSGIYNRSEVIDLTSSGDFTGGSIRVTRTGNIVSVQGITNPTFSSSSNPASAAGLIPTWARPPEQKIVLPTMSATAVTFMSITSTGALSFAFRDWAGSLTAQTSTTLQVTLTYAVEDTTQPVLTESQLSLQTIKGQCIINSSNQTITSTAETTVTFNSATIDTHSAFSAGSNGFVIPKSGKYRVSYKLLVTTMTADEQFIVNLKSDSTIVERCINRAASTETIFGSSRILDLDKGDVITVTITSAADTNYAVRGFTSDSFLEIESLPDYTLLGAIREKDVFQTKVLSANVTTNTTVSDLTFSNLEIGKAYTVSGQVVLSTDAGSADETIVLDCYNGATLLGRSAVLLTESSDSAEDVIPASIYINFVAASTTVTFVSSDASANSRILGNNTRAQTFVQLEERNNLRETTKFS